MTVILRCPRCKQSMRYEPKNNLVRKRKTCVYCGKNFAVNEETFVCVDKA